MSTRTYGVFINTVGLLYASLGFSLSVLALLFGIFHHFITPSRARSFQPRPHLPRKLGGPRTLRSFSDQPRKVTVPQLPEDLSVEEERTHDVKSLQRRSKSLIPIVTIDHFESANALDFLEFLPKPVLPAETSLPNPANTDGTAKDLSAMNRLRIKRRCSSPLLSRPTTLPMPSSHHSLPIPMRKESRSCSIKMLRRAPTAPDLKQETFTMKLDALFLRKAKKKKSLTLRTQPYGAPYFCPPPLPIPNRGLRSASPDHDNQTIPIRVPR